jgi:hypothetical protein
MLAVVFCFDMTRHFLQGAEYKTTVYSDHENLTYVKSALSLTRPQARWAHELNQSNFQLLYRKGSANAKADKLSRCPAFTSGVGGTTSATNQTMLRKNQWLEVGAMELHFDNGIESIQIAALDVEQLLPEGKERIKEKAMFDEKYREWCKQVASEGNIIKIFTIKAELLCWKNRIYVPAELQ